MAACTAGAWSTANPKHYYGLIDSISDRSVSEAISLLPILSQFANLLDNSSEAISRAPYRASFSGKRLWRPQLQLRDHIHTTSGWDALAPTIIDIFPVVSPPHGFPERSIPLMFQQKTSPMRTGTPSDEMDRRTGQRAGASLVVLLLLFFTLVPVDPPPSGVGISMVILS